MTEPITTNKSLIVPNTGDLSGTWGTAALNPNFQIIDAMFGGVTTISLSSATTLLLSVPATTGIWGGSVPQSSNALIVFTGAQTGNAVVQFTLPGFYIVHNKCTGTAYVKLSPATGLGSSIGAPPGRKAHVFFDGTDMDYVDMPEVGAPLQLRGVSTTPPWMLACSVLPYLVMDGSVHTASLYPQLAQLLGSTFGGNGASTFGVPDERSRVAVGIDIAAVVGGGLAARLTTAIAGFNGTTMSASGGSQSPQAHNHTATVTDPGHKHTFSGGSVIVGNSGSGYAAGGFSFGSGTIGTTTTGITVAVNTGLIGGAGNVQPTIVSFTPFIKNVKRMPFGSVTLVPGVDVTKTPTLLQTSISESQLIRFRDGLVQKYGGWERFYSFNVAGVTRDLHAWQDLNDTKHLLIGSTTKLGILTGDSYVDITPQTLTTNPTNVDFTTTSGSNTVVVVDNALTAPVTNYDTIMLLTPVAVGGLLLSGVYPIVQSTGATSYTIEAAAAATSSVPNGGAVPAFTTTLDEATVNVAMAGHTLVVGDSATFQVSTTGNGVTISGTYPVSAVVDANNFEITAANQATASGSFSMNGGDPSILYYITPGPPASGSGYGIGGYGDGGYGTGTGSSNTLTGDQITASDWTSDNWGEIALACPMNGPLYQYNSSGGFLTASMVPTAPPFNLGIFVSNSLQILFCWGSTNEKPFGLDQDPMLVRWSDLGNYAEFRALSTNQAGAFRIPIGSTLRAAMAVSNQNLFWTDLDLWAANYAGYPLVFGFNKIGSGAGAISSHAVQQLRNGVFWMGASNFYSYTGSGVSVIRCPVWDYVFQRLNTDYVSNVRAMPNTPFNEVGWLFPSTDSATGENDSYVKFNISDPSQPWDYGTLGRSAWIDQTVLGSPISATSNGIIIQQEQTNDAAGEPMTSSFTTGYFYIAEGEDFAMIDQIYPDMIWGTYGADQSAQVYITINTVNFPGDTPMTSGPYLMTQSTKYITTRARGRQASFTFQSSDVGSFWRVGRVRYRFQQSVGRR